MKAFVTTGQIRNGLLQIRNRPGLNAWAAHQRDGEMVVTIERAHATRSLDANALYWAGHVQPLAEYTGYTPLEVHAYLKKRFLPNQHLMIQNAHGEVIDESDIEPTTTTLNTVEFSDYLHQIQEWALTELGVECGSNQGGVG